LVPIALMLRPGSRPTRGAVTAAGALVILGGLAQTYVIIIGGQAFPLTLFPGMEVHSSFYDGVVASYLPSLPEIGLGLGGVSLAAAIVVVGLRVLRFLPNDLRDPA
jgi:molybdopterin-containing oxidoreductase family membrane subunit